MPSAPTGPRPRPARRWPRSTPISHGHWVPKQDPVRFVDYADTWLVTRPLRPRTRETDADHLRLRINPTLGSLPVTRLTPAVVRAWHADLRRQVDATGRGGAFLSHSYRVLRAILTTAVEDELLPRNPCTIKGAGTDRPRERRLPTEAEIWAVADAVPPRHRTLVWLAAATALRSAELAGLRRCDVDLLHRQLHVRQTYVEPARGPAFFGPPTSDAGTRTIHLPAVVVPLLEEHLAQWSGHGQDGLILLSEKGPPLSRHNRRW